MSVLPEWVTGHASFEASARHVEKLDLVSHIVKKQHGKRTAQERDVLQQWLAHTFPVFFKQFPQVVVRACVAHLKMKQFRAGDRPFQEGDHCARLYFIKRGRIKLTSRSCKTGNLRAFIPKYYPATARATVSNARQSRIKRAQDGQRARKTKWTVIRNMLSATQKGEKAEKVAKFSEVARYDDKSGGIVHFKERVVGAHEMCGVYELPHGLVEWIHANTPNQFLKFMQRTGAGDRKRDDENKLLVTQLNKMARIWSAEVLPGPEDAEAEPDSACACECVSLGILELVECYQRSTEAQLNEMRVWLRLNVPLFSLLSQHAFTHLLGKLRFRNAHCGDVIGEPGTPASWIVIRKGTVSINSGGAQACVEKCNEHYMPVLGFELIKHGAAGANFKWTLLVDSDVCEYMTLHAHFTPMFLHEKAVLKTYLTRYYEVCFLAQEQHRKLHTRGDAEAQRRRNTVEIGNLSKKKEKEERIETEFAEEPERPLAAHERL